MDIGLRGDGARSLRIIADNHDDTDAGGAALPDCRGHGWAQWIRNSDKVQKFEWKVTRRLRAREIGRDRPPGDPLQAHALLPPFVPGLPQPGTLDVTDVKHA